MPNFAQHQFVASLDADDGTTLTDYSGDIISISLSLNSNGSTYHVGGSRSAKALVGGFTGSGTITLVNDNTADELADVLRQWVNGSGTPATKTLQIQEPDGTSGSTQYEMEILPKDELTLVNGVAGAGDPSQLTFAFNVSGDVTITTIS